MVVAVDWPVVSALVVSSGVVGYVCGRRASPPLEEWSAPAELSVIEEPSADSALYAPAVTMHGVPQRHIVGDDGTVHYDGTDGAAALQTWEALKHSESLPSGVTWFESGQERDRMEASQ